MGVGTEDKSRSELEKALALINRASWSRSLTEAARCTELLDALRILLDAYPRPLDGIPDDVQRALARRRKGRSTAKPKRAQPEWVTHLIAQQVIRDSLETTLDHPSSRLAVYGTLAPGESNHHVVASIPGRWEDGTVRGVVGKMGPYPTFHWKKPGGVVAVMVLHSAYLTNHWQRLDRFEGPGYRRILVPIERAGDEVVVANLYEGLG